jgi:hypothetical protein
MSAETRPAASSRSGTIRLADPGRNDVTARHHNDGEGNEREKEECQEQGGHAVPASLLLSLMRPKVCLIAHCVPFRNGQRNEGNAWNPRPLPRGTSVPWCLSAGRSTIRHSQPPVIRVLRTRRPAHRCGTSAGPGSIDTRLNARICRHATSG